MKLISEKSQESSSHPLTITTEQRKLNAIIDESESKLLMTDKMGYTPKEVETTSSNDLLIKSIGKFKIPDGHTLTDSHRSTQMKTHKK